ncbi:unnamed protein product (macronuclear) [Paramecium tetraurelia]|uniref:DUF8019 domain-containing protein n=1 Tax=Paramecium tetraurelia TaxID=5888 RepID=A0DCM8_PARTE|nr:uncharacterized protein GSPATT00015674001 [Paramecium tetraurelia]CAK80795.1 unnamed protein product [Paramecium tetraurelia]|eukprot:XP_001448192.1 hypothetical protein (macronuclear) [Paramecium tetraurelia strain d4-2]
MFIFINLFILTIYSLEEYDCGLNVQTLCAPGMKIREKYQPYFGFWNFDLDKLVDSGPHNHITNINELSRSSSMMGTGVYFKKDSEFEVQFVPSFEGSQWTVSFQIMFEEIGRKIKEVGNILALFDEIEDHQNSVSIVVDTTIPTFAIKENSQIVASNMRLQPQLWYQLFLVLSDKSIKLFVNGIECAKLQSGKAISFKKLKIGLENELPSFNLDTLKLFNRKIEEWEILASSQLFQLNGDWVLLHCENCQFEQAKQCPFSYHLCTTVELYSFGINIAKNMGWGVWNNTNIWSSESNPNKFKNKEGLALCCRDLEFVLI